MWHASAARHDSWLTSELLEVSARKALEDVGDASLGEWVEVTRAAVHVRRRISAEESKRVAPVLDIRGTREAAERTKPVRHLLPVGWKE